MPLMHPDAAAAFERLKAATIAGSGFDFLAACGDVCRPATYTSAKDGVAERSWHKTGRAFDYDQECRRLVIVLDVRAGQTFFRTYLKCVEQDGSQGQLGDVIDYRGHRVKAYLFDFTAAAAAHGFTRIPAWKGWQKNYNRREFWHYQFDQGLTWTAAMAQLSDRASTEKASGSVTYGRNDRGPAVTEIQTVLYKLGFLPHTEIDGVFGGRTFAAVTAFQERRRLKADGLVGPDTIAALGLTGKI